MDPSSIAIALPDEVIELILLNCDAKFVFRFKSVSKSWHSIISDPRFCTTLQSKLSENHNKFLIDDISDWTVNSRLHMIELVDGKSITKTELPYPRKGLNTLGSCNGLILLHRYIGRCNEYMVWNPLIRKHITIIPRFHPDKYRRLKHHGFYYDPTTNDHKIALVFNDRYAVYSCKNGSWSEMELPNLEIEYPIDACIDGFFYTRKGKEIAYFDARDRKVGRFELPNEANNDHIINYVNVVSGRLCLHFLDQDWKHLQLWVMEEDGSFKKRWRKLIDVEKVVAPYVSNPKTVCLSSGDDDDDVVVFSGKDDVTGEVPKGQYRKRKHFIYNPRQNCSFHEIEFEWDDSAVYFPYTENLYMPYSNMSLV